MISTPDYNSQIQRIKDKLPRAKSADPKLKVFGANNHRYVLNAPAAMEDVTEFEERYAIQLPECYKAFILQVGNGGVAFENSASRKRKITYCQI